MLGEFEKSLRRSDASRNGSRCRGRTVLPRPAASTCECRPYTALSSPSPYQLSGRFSGRPHAAPSSPSPSQLSGRPGSGMSERSGQTPVSAVTQRLYNSSTLASAAKARPCSTSEQPPSKENLEALASKVVKTSDFQEGKRVSQLITLEIGDDEERSHGFVVKRRRSLPNINQGDSPLGYSATSKTRRRTTQSVGAFGDDQSHFCILDEHQVICQEVCSRRLGSDGSSGSSSPTRTDSPSPPSSPAPSSSTAFTHRRCAKSCAVHTHHVPDNTLPRFQSTLRCHNKIAKSPPSLAKFGPPHISVGVQKRFTKTSVPDPRSVLSCSLRLDRTSSDSRVEEMMREAREYLQLSHFLTDHIPGSMKKNVVYFPARKLKKQNGRSFMDLSRILEEHHTDYTDGTKTDKQLADEEAWLSTENVWLVHKDGFSAAQLLTKPSSLSSDGRVCVRLQASREVLEVDEDDVEKANPCSLDRLEDLSQLRHLNESSALHTLRQRFGAQLVHTAAGATTLVINPMAGLNLYSDKVVQLFRGFNSEDMPPHVYATAQSAYRALLSQHQDQSVVVLGRSGSGKTTCCRHLLHYLVSVLSPSATAASASTRPLTVDRLRAVWTLLESFGNCRTVMNTNATRFTSIFSLDFDHFGQVASGSVQVFLLERDRVVKRPEGEPNFHIFYQLLAGADEALRQRLQLDDSNEPNSFMTPLQRHADKQKAAVTWSLVQEAASRLDIQRAESEVLWAVLASIYHLGAAGVTKGPSDRYQFASALAARRAATLLGVRLEELARAVFSGDSLSSGSWSSTLPPASAVRSTRCESPAERLLEGRDALNGFVAGLYAQLVSALVSLVNRCISKPAHTINSILVVDSAGFQNPASCGRQTGASFDDLCFNYVQERLQLLFHEHTFINERQRYAQENIVLGCCELESADLSTPAPLVSALDQCPPVGAMLRCSQAERRGLFWLLDEAALLPDASDAAFLHRVCRLYDTHADKQLLRVGPGESSMTLQHFQGTNPVTYDVTGWVAAARETSAFRRAATLLQESHREPVSRMFVAARGNLSSGMLGGSVVGIEGSLSLRRAASIRRTFTTGTAGIKRNSRALVVKFQMDGIVEHLRRSRTRFVHCLLPQHTAGLCELKSPAATTADKVPPQDPHEILLNVPLLRSQFRGAQLLDALQLHKQGFPEHLSFAEFRRRFGLLAADLQLSAVSSDTSASDGVHRVALEHLLVNLDLDPLSYRLGLSQIFFRSGALLQLQERRDERLKDTVVRLQACCRAHLARKKFSQLKMDDVATRCVQRNVRKYLAVRNWSWWRLLVRIIPLLNVHRTEDQLKSANEELGKLRIRLEKAESERQQYKFDADKLESKLSEITADLSEEHHTANLATGRLEAEQRERMRLENQLQEVQGDFNRMCSMNEKLETELLYTHRSSELDESPAGSGGSENEETPGSTIMYRRRFEYVARELEYTKKRMQQQHDDDVEQMMIVKKQLDKKAEAAYEEIDEQRQIVAQLKRKVSRLTGEASDLKMHLDEQTSRNAVLEKRQRKFDIDMQLLEETLNKERAGVERTVREKDLLQGKIYSLHNELAAMRLELQMSDEKVMALRQDLDELEGPGGSEDELSALRRGRQELERRCHDQEEELDDLAGQVSMLEQAKLRLEMSLEQMRKENRHEAAQKDDEAEEFRANMHKKIKGLELQLEMEHDERTALVREKHDLERRIILLTEKSLTLDDQEAVLRYKRDLKRTRALLKDAQLQLERAHSESTNKAQLRQLKNQLEDAELAQAAAVRGRQAAECELQDLRVQLEEAQRVRAAAECRHLTSSREVHTLQLQVEEQDEELQEVMRKYKCAVVQLSADQQTLSDQCDQLAALETERATLREQLHELSGRLDALQEESGCRDDQRRLELRQRELQSRLDFEQTTKQRLESQLVRLKEAVQKATGDAIQARQQEQIMADQLKKQQRQLRELKEDLANAERKECDAMSQVRALTKQLECSETEVSQSRTDLRLALKRIVDLQNAIQGDMDSEEASNSDSLTDSDEDGGEDLESFLSAHLPSSSGRENLSKVSSMSSAKLEVPSMTCNGDVSAALPSSCGDPSKLNGRSQSDA